MTYAIVAIVVVSVVAYLAAGMANAVMVILNDVEPKPEERGIVLAYVLFWPACILVDWPVWIARRIKARREAAREKPRPFSEVDGL